MEDPAQDRHSRSIVEKHEELPPSPAQTEENDSESSEEVDIPLPPPTTIPTETLDVDKKTPDAHVPRDPRLIRLTGVHPFNVEAPLSALFNEGFLTSAELFYVRNHGAVPKVKDEEIPDWEFSVEGLVRKPLTLTLRQLIAEYEQITCPITLVCAGNRRKEQNQVRKSKGFSWGPAGVSTALFTGVAMSELIKRARPKKKARYVCMEGADKLPNGFYGTSVKLNWVMDPNKGMMLSYKMNGEMLRPDHGKPLRAVIPGQIGGRSVKWLKKLIVTAAPSDNWYHIYDNRVLPTMVSPDESANDPKWWMDDRYAIYDLSTNSAIAYPAHEEQACLVGGPEKYRAKGYAYGGGGRRVTRVELSLDKGRTWRLANIDYPEDRYRDAEQILYGGRLDMSWRESCFCWCQWSLDFRVSELADAKDIVVRAMDESMNIQPKEMYWSVLGMMNNPWFRVTISKEGDYLRFEHPTQPALMPGGWMERVKKAGGNLMNGQWGEKLAGEEVQTAFQEVAKEVPMTKPDLKHEITIDELRKHDNDTDPWFVVNNEVYSGTAFLKDHPGGAQSIVSAAGLDTTDEFMAIHSETAKAMMPTYHLGTLDSAAKIALSEPQSETASNEPRDTFLNPRSWTKAVLSSKKKISADTVIFTFTLEHKTQMLGLPVGQHLMIRLRDPVQREAIIRPYTPISEMNSKGRLDVLIKLYLEGDIGGKMSKAMNSLPVGHGVDFKGPIGKFTYLGKGLCSINGTEKKVKKFAMICGGSGITPIFQVFRAVMRDKDDPTTCTVLNGNRLFEDILCKEDLDALLTGNEDRGEVIHTLTKAPETWKGLRGRINGELVQKHCECHEETLVLVCGPEALEKSIHVALKEQGWSDDQILFF
ncbi:hypothetical protein OEA41_007929 [Lepraria neglecta]|uniref:Nitrate reductase n=1 Tax=Lepraria neglecta TaxID=209136 RepID=A0AAE0DND9_9LECA|nr:hypothetical protein OEA41_007929 [Lepraria neglecta]